MTFGFTPQEFKPSLLLDQISKLMGEKGKISFFRWTKKIQIPIYRVGFENFPFVTVQAIRTPKFNNDTFSKG